MQGFTYVVHLLLPLVCGEDTSSDHESNGDSLRPHTDLHHLTNDVSADCERQLAGRTFCGYVWYLLRKMMALEVAIPAAQPPRMMLYWWFMPHSLIFWPVDRDSQRCRSSNSLLSDNNRFSPTLSA